LQAANDGGEHQASGQREGDEDQRLLEGRRLGAERQVAYDAVDGQRQREIKQAGDEAEDEDRRDIRRLRTHQAEETVDGPGVVLVLMIGVIVVP